MTSTSACRSFAAALFLMPAVAGGADLSLAVARFEPDDGIVDSLYDTAVPCYLLGFELALPDGLSWSSTLLYYGFESQVVNLENNVRLIALTTGFKQNLRGGGERSTSRVEPFLGAQVGYSVALVQAENESTEVTYGEETTYGLAVAWEVGVDITNLGIEGLDLEARLVDLTIGPELYGGIGIGGRLLSVGFRYALTGDD